MVKHGEVYWVNLDPTVGTEIKKIRPALVVSPDDLNAVLPRVIIAPLTSKGQALGCRPRSFLITVRRVFCSTKSAVSINGAYSAKWAILKVLCGIPC
jgi:mRNA-degrading endonuclease toxin of MazEF toxin-antitoxin module